MKVTEFKKLIREEVRRVLSEATAKYKVGQTVDDLNGDEPFKVVKVYPNKQAALVDIKKTISPRAFKDMMEEVESMYDNYRPIDKRDDMRPWYVLEPLEGDDMGYPYLNPEAYVFDAGEQMDGDRGEKELLDPMATHLVKVKPNNIIGPMEAWKNDPKAMAMEFRSDGDGNIVKKLDDDTYIYYQTGNAYIGVVGRPKSNKEFWQAVDDGDKTRAYKLVMNMKKMAK